jgi:LPS export ABC transporter permease LptF/LPS export ABC transporter permease LptG
VLEYPTAGMRIIDRYVFREVFSQALLGLAVFTFVLFVPQLVQLMSVVVRHSGGIGSVAKLFACSLATVLVFTIPMSVLVGVLLGLGRLSADGEIIGLNASGLSLRRLLMPVGGFAILAALATSGATLWLAPLSLRTLHSLEETLKASQVTLAVQPRVFDERFPHLVLYVQDVDATGTLWRGVFLAGSDGGAGSNLTLAENAIVISDRQQDLIQLHLGDGSTHQYQADDPSNYGFTAFRASDLPIELTSQEATQQAKLSVPEMSTRELLTGPASDSRDARVEWQRRLAFPAACIVFALLGVPVGVRPRRGGRASGIVLTLILISGYYLVFVAGVHYAEQGILSPITGVWAANVMAAIAGLAMVRRIEHLRGEEWYSLLWDRMYTLLKGSDSAPLTRKPAEPTVDADPISEVRPKASARTRRGMGFPLLIDIHILKTFLGYFLLLLAGFLVIFDAFTLFDLLQDISRNHAPVSVVANYFRYLTPMMVYQLSPLAALVATLVTLGAMAKNNELTAFKASGISMYRVVLPLILAGLFFSCGLFALDDTYLPYANQRQDALRNQIKGRPAQTYYQPAHQWIFGQGNRIYNYELFDVDRKFFGGLSVFELDPVTFQMTRRVFAERARWEVGLQGWVLEQGWIRDFNGSTVTRYTPFRVLSLAELTEPPGYFRREVLPSYQMNWRQLRKYIDGLQQAGFDTARLAVQWQTKFAFPLMAAIIVFLAVPFAFLVGTRGAVGGLALAVGISIVYWSVAKLFEAMGAVGQLPPLAAGWAPDAIFSFLAVYFFLKMPT